MNRLAVITGFLGRVANRYMSYQPDRDIAEKLAMAGRIEGADGVELCYPADFDDPDALASLLQQHGLGVSAINFRSRRTGAWLRGSCTSSSAAERGEVLDDLRRAIDHAARIGCNRITTCPLNDGADAPLQIDYVQAYDDAAEVFARACAHNPDVRICIEYKKSDPVARCMVGTAGDVAAFAQLVGAANLGATLDIGHAIMAEERPAQSAALLHKTGRLFYVHLNDNDGRWDWDMLPGLFHIWEFVELFQTLQVVGYDNDWYSFDVFPKEIDTVETFSAAMRFTRNLERLTGRIDPHRLAALQRERNPVTLASYLHELLGIDGGDT